MSSPKRNLSNFELAEIKVRSNCAIALVTKLESIFEDPNAFSNKIGYSACCCSFDSTSAQLLFISIGSVTGTEA